MLVLTVNVIAIGLISFVVSVVSGPFSNKVLWKDPETPLNGRLN